MPAEIKNTENKQAKEASLKEAPHKEDSLYETGLSFSQIKELMTHMKKEGVSSFQMGEGKTSLSLTREKETVYVAGPSDAHPVFAGSAVPETHHAAAETDREEALPQGHIVTSPVVGVFYDSASPEQEPYVTLGSYVKKGDVLCIIEAMKLMNEVNSPVSGRIKEILVKKASRVEYGQKLFVIDPGAPEEESHE